MARPYVAMVDYGTGNVHSLGKALERAGCTPRLTRDPDELGRAAGIVLPGVGAFGPAWRRLEAAGLVPVLRELVAAGRPLLGICLGMQLLFEGSREDGEWPGFGFLPGWVEPFAPAPAPAPSAPRTRAAIPAMPENPGAEVAGAPPEVAGAPLKVPHMGWNRVSVPAGSRLLAGLGDGFYAYFVHSYRVPWPLEPLRRRPSPSSADPDAPGGEAEDASSRRDEPATPLVALADYGGPFVAAVEWGPVCGTQFHPEKSGPAGLKILRNFGAMCGACDPGP